MCLQTYKMLCYLYNFVYTIPIPFTQITLCQLSAHSQDVYIIYTNRRGGLYRTPRFVYCCYNESFPTLTGIKILDIDVV